VAAVPSWRYTEPAEGTSQEPCAEIMSARTRYAIYAIICLGIIQVFIGIQQGADNWLRGLITPFVLSPVIFILIALDWRRERRARQLRAAASREQR